MKDIGFPSSFIDIMMLRPATDEFLQRRLEDRQVVGEREQRFVHQFDRDRPEPDQMLGRVHGFVEGTEMAGAHRPLAQHRPELELYFGGEAERSLGPYENVGKIVLGRRREGVQVVSADPALDLREAQGDLVGFAGPQRKQVPGEAADG